MRSWDLNQPDVVRPLASSNVGDILVLAIRLNMKCRELSPGNGVMRGDGDGLNISSTSIRGIGIVLQFGVDMDQKVSPEERRTR